MQQMKKRLEKDLMEAWHQFCDGKGNFLLALDQLTWSWCPCALILTFEMKKIGNYSNLWLRIVYTLPGAPQAARVKVLASGNATERCFRCIPFTLCVCLFVCLSFSHRKMWSPLHSSMSKVVFRNGIPGNGSFNLQLHLEIVIWCFTTLNASGWVAQCLDRG
jgi:hypothetical protein